MIVGENGIAVEFLENSGKVRIIVFQNVGKVGEIFQGIDMGVNIIANLSINGFFGECAILALRLFGLKIPQDQDDNLIEYSTINMNIYSKGNGFFSSYLSYLY